MRFNIGKRFSACRSVFLQNKVLLAGFLFLVLLTSCTAQKTPPLDGKLNVLVRPPDRTIEPISVEQLGALPVRSGGAMCLDVHLNQPAYIYLVWINSAGQLMPLYPWNNETLEILDLDQAPPERRPTKLIFSPLLGKSWPIGEQVGPETVLLLVRRTPLPKEMRIGELIRGLPQRPELDPSVKLATVQFPKAADSSKDDMTAGSQLTAFAQPLKDQFELVHVVHFAHENDASRSSGGSPSD